MEMDSSQDVARRFHDEVVKRAATLGLNTPDDFWCWFTSYSAQRQKSPRKADVDWMQESLWMEFTHARFAIASAEFWFSHGLTSINMPYRPQPFDLWFFNSIDDGFSRLYGCMQRVALLIHYFFPLASNDRAVTPFSARSLTKCSTMVNDVDVGKLCDFVDGKFSQLNQKRKDIIHYLSTFAYVWKRFFESIIPSSNCHNSATIENERNGWVPFLIDVYKGALLSVQSASQIISRHYR